MYVSTQSKFRICGLATPKSIDKLETLKLWTKAASIYNILEKTFNCSSSFWGCYTHYGVLNTNKQQSYAYYLKTSVYNCIYKHSQHHFLRALQTSLVKIVNS